MAKTLKVSLGQYSDKGHKPINQDFHGCTIPHEPQLSTKGIAIALADGISSSEVSQIASETAVKNFLDDYYCTSDAWSVKKSGQQVLQATSSWLHAINQKSEFRFDKNKGYVCTLSALIIKSTQAYIFHVGDARIYRLRKNRLEQLTLDHRHWVSQHESYLSRALGAEDNIEVDHQTVHLTEGDVFILATDGVYEHIEPDALIASISLHAENLSAAATQIVSTALKNGSKDNLTIQLIRIDELPQQSSQEAYQQLSELPFPPQLEARAIFDGYQIIREVHATSRSHVYLAIDIETAEQVIIKTPSIDLRNDPAYLERFLMEEWIARRLNNPHILKPCKHTRKRHYTYVVTEYIEGQTLRQWMIDNPKPDMEKVRNICEQIAKGLRSFHRMEMLHQDLRPENIMIDTSGTLKIIDFGSTRVAGILEISTPIERQDLLGTAQYTAPEYFLGESGTYQSDHFSLAVIAYEMLSGKLPYGTQVASARTKSAQNRLRYQSVLNDEREIPAWVDDVLRKALQPNPYKRYSELSEFIYNLRHPNKAFLNKSKPPLMERNPVLFWQSVSAILCLVIGWMLMK